MYTTYHILKRYIKHKKHNFITLPISNKIMIKKWRKNYCLHILLHCFSIIYIDAFYVKIMTNYTSSINIILKL